MFLHNPCTDRDSLLSPITERFEEMRTLSFERGSLLLAIRKWGQSPIFVVARGGLIGEADWTDEQRESARRVSAEGANQWTRCARPAGAPFLTMADQASISAGRYKRKPDLSHLIL